MTKSTLPCMLALAVIPIPATAVAQPVLQLPCPADLLTVNAALERIEWARRCALLTNTSGPNSSFLSTRIVNLSFTPAMEYQEIDPDRAYSGRDFDYEVNFSYYFCHDGSTPLVTEFQETSGPTAGFWKWSTLSQRPRPLFPSFGTSLDFDSSIQLFPHPTLEDCNLYQRDPATGSLSPWPGNFYVMLYCVSP